MAIKYTKWLYIFELAIKYTNLFYSSALENIPKLFLFENMPSENTTWNID
jgi:hypothetical protein